MMPPQAAVVALTGITKNHADVFEVLIGQVGKDTEIAAVFGEALCVLGHAALSSHLQSPALRRTARGRF
jgi:hypothetical protein